jgi:hypothetical protein
LLLALETPPTYNYCSLSLDNDMPQGESSRLLWRVHGN